MTIPGLCQCGCEHSTRIAERDDPRYGSVKGQPRRFVKGHDKRKHRVRHAGGYVLLHAPDHPRAIQGKVLEHILVVECTIGRVLPVGAVIHHVNDQTADNRNSNLVVLQSSSEHGTLHRRRRVLRRGGDPWTQRLCCICKQAKDTSEFYRSSDRAFSAACKACDRARALARQRMLRAS